MSNHDSYPQVLRIRERTLHGTSNEMRSEHAAIRHDFNNIYRKNRPRLIQCGGLNLIKR